MTYIYTEPVTDRSQQDVDTRAYKAFFNVSDWTRIYQNALFVNRIYDVLMGIVVPFDALSAPSIASVPSVSDFNTLVANINRICTQVNLTGVLGLALQKDDWTAGTDTPIFNYANINQWEEMLAKMLDLARFIASDVVFCGVAGAGQQRFYQARWRAYKWVQPAAGVVFYPRTNAAICGGSFSKQNKYRRY